MLDRAADPSQVILYHKNSNISILRKDLLCLQPGTWLNDEVVNVYMGLLQVTATLKNSPENSGPRAMTASICMRA